MGPGPRLVEKARASMAAAGARDYGERQTGRRRPVSGVPRE